MNKYLFNPFKYVAGWESLIAGVFILILTSVIGYFSHIHMPDLISVKTNYGLPFYILLLQNLSNWLVFSVLLFLTAKFASKSAVRAIDIFGTQSLARVPYIFATLAGFSGSLKKFGDYMIWSALQTGEPVQISAGELVLAVTILLFTILLTVWMIALMFNAFKTSANLKGTKLVVIFISVFIVSLVITSLISIHLINAVSAIS